MIQSSWVVFSAVAFIHLFFERVGRQKPESSGRTCQRASFKLESTNKKFTWRFRSPDINVHRVLLQAIKSTSGNLSSSSEKLFNCSRKSPLLYFFFFFFCMWINSSCLFSIRHVKGGLARLEEAFFIGDTFNGPDFLTPKIFSEIGSPAPLQPLPRVIWIIVSFALFSQPFTSSTLCCPEMCFIVALLKSTCGGKYCGSHFWKIQSPTLGNATKIPTSQFQHSTKMEQENNSFHLYIPI